MTRNQPNRDEPYRLQSLGQAQTAVMKAGGMTWAESMHTHWQAGFFVPKDKADNPLKLRSLFKAIRVLERGTDKQKKLALDLSKQLESVWGLQKAYVTASEGDIDAMRELRERWGDVQLPPVDGGFVNGIAADESLIDSIVRGLR